MHSRVFTNGISECTNSFLFLGFRTSADHLMTSPQKHVYKSARVSKNKERINASLFTRWRASPPTHNREPYDTLLYCPTSCPYRSVCGTDAACSSNTIRDSI